MPELQNPENFQQTFLLVGGLIVLIFALRGFFRGIVRLVFGMVSLAVAVLFGYKVFLHGRDWFEPVLGGAETSTLAWVAAGSALLTYLVLGLIGRSIADSFAGDGKVAGPARMAGAIFSLIPSLFFIWVIALVLRHTAAVSKLETLDQFVVAADGTTAPEIGFWPKAMAQLNSGWVGWILDKTDPVADKATEALSQLLFLMKDPDAWERVKQNPQVATLLSNPSVQKIMDNEEVLYEVAHSSYAGVLREPMVAATAASPQVHSQLRELQVDEVAKSALFGPQPAATIAPDGTEVRRALPVRQRQRQRPAMPQPR